MLTISQSDVKKTGGFLAALTDKSCEYIRSILPTGTVVDSGGKEADLERVIVHTDPHLDEYFAELVFRACLPVKKRGCDFLEQSIFSKDNDLACQHLWPAAAVLGIGGTVSGGAHPLFLFDEHVSGQAKAAPSCSKLVTDKMLRKLPGSVATLLNEVNVIDEYGGAHQHSLANLIKLLHDVRFAFKLDPSGSRFVSDMLTPDWKRAIVDASIAAVIYCLEENIDLVGNPSEKRGSLEGSLDNYVQNTPHRTNPHFSDAEQFIRSTYGDQARVFAEAVLRDHSGPIRDAGGGTIPQMMVFSRVCFACERCWGENIRNVIATHFWEVAMQGQLNFYPVWDAVAEMFKKNKDRLVSPVGFLRRAVLPPIDVGRGRKAPVWIVSISPDSSIFRPNQAISNFINGENPIDPHTKNCAAGCGLVFVQDTIRGTSALSKCSGVPQDKWERLVKLIATREAECWHVIYSPSGGMAPFIVNGNKANQHVPRTGLDVTTLSQLVRRTFY